MISSIGGKISTDDSEHLAVDVEMCSLVLELRQREKELAKMNNEMKVGTFSTLR